MNFKIFIDLFSHAFSVCYAVYIILGLIDIGNTSWQVILTELRNEYRAFREGGPWEYPIWHSNKMALPQIKFSKMRFSLLIPILTLVTCLPADFDPLTECL